MPFSSQSGRCISDGKKEVTASNKNFRNVADIVRGKNNTCLIEL